MRFTEEFERLRRVMVPSSTNPDRMVASNDFSEPETFRGFLDSESSLDEANANREGISSSAILFVEDTRFDIRRGDRVRAGERMWEVLGFPSAPMNPFSGWRPYKEVRLREVRG